MFGPGSKLQRFEVVGHIGTGGMGSVYRAHDPQLDRDVAIKVMTQPSDDLRSYVTETDTIDLRSDAPATTEDLFREARMMARLSHPNVLSVYEVGIADSSVFVVTEHVDGCDLRAWLAEPRSQHDVLDVFNQAGKGLAAAHARGIVHRDFKPDNVLIDGEGRVRVADFGLSHLVAPTHAMRRLEDAKGTPRYMAPELWRGDPATPKSDVFAFCVALAEAFGAEAGPELDRVLRERGVAPPLRAAIAQGLSDEPALRPELLRILALLSTAPVKRRWWLAYAAVGVVVLAGAGYVALTLREPSCELEPAWFASRWNGELRASLLASLRAHATAATRSRVDAVVATADDARLGVEREWTTTCKASHAGKLTPAQTAVRRSCLERRAIELGSAVRSIASFQAATFVLAADERLDGMVPAADCAELDAKPLTADRAAVTALYDRLYAGDQAPIDQQVGLATALEQDALKLGEQEVAARAALWRGIIEARTDQYDAGAATLQRVLQYASDLKWMNLQARALAERMSLAVAKQDAATAKSFAELARPLLDKPLLSPRNRVKLHMELAHTEDAAGDYKSALQLYRKALELVQVRKRQTFDELTIRSRLIRPMNEVGEPGAVVVALARQNVEFARSIEGDHGGHMPEAYGQLSVALQNNRQLPEAVEASRRALELAIELYGPHHPTVSGWREALAIALANSGSFEEARGELLKLLAEYEANPAFAHDRARLLGTLATASFLSGHHDEALHTEEQGIEESASQYGIDHPATLSYRLQRVWMELEVEHYDDAQRHIEALQRSYRKQPGEPPLMLIVLDGYNQARVLLFGRGNAKEAEAKTRAAMAAFGKLDPNDPRVTGELGGADVVNSTFALILGQSLVEQKRFPEARKSLDAALAIASKSPQIPPNQLAAIELWLAYCDEAQGKRSEALARVERARPILVSQPSDVFEMKRLEQLKARLTK